MTKLEKILRSKRHEITIWATRFDGSEFVASVIRGIADLSSPEVEAEINEAKADTSVEKLEVVAMRRCRGGKRVAIGRPLMVVGA